jgi:hypothetical protein
MNVYSYSEAKQNLSKILDKAKSDGKVIIKRKDGSTFEIKLITDKKSPLDVEGVNVSINKQEIINILREVRAKK